MDIVVRAKAPISRSEWITLSAKSRSVMWEFRHYGPSTGPEGKIVVSARIHGWHDAVARLIVPDDTTAISAGVTHCPWAAGKAERPADGKWPQCVTLS